ncbi:MAG: hypothetical protein Solumvirus1_55 [Solumvirus sp.]|uniref:Uncharacterized protein n=1 Tax=Solumvirus sp. TaxID=2487773 RepID=A0A3G5AG62_9VIRU|nr:MAG: hypothetical protein Solumvirus1_55 [Solumvirus sp.]
MSESSNNSENVGVTASTTNISKASNLTQSDTKEILETSNVKKSKKVLTLLERLMMVTTKTEELGNNFGYDERYIKINEKSALFAKLLFDANNAHKFCLSCGASGTVTKEDLDKMNEYISYKKKYLTMQRASLDSIIAKYDQLKTHHVSHIINGFEHPKKSSDTKDEKKDDKKSDKPIEKNDKKDDKPIDRNDKKDDKIVEKSTDKLINKKDEKNDKPIDKKEDIKNDKKDDSIPTDFTSVLLTRKPAEFPKDKISIVNTVKDELDKNGSANTIVPARISLFESQTGSTNNVSQTGSTNNVSQTEQTKTATIVNL